MAAVTHCEVLTYAEALTDVVGLVVAMVGGIGTGCPLQLSGSAGCPLSCSKHVWQIGRRSIGDQS